MTTKATEAGARAAFIAAHNHLDLTEMNDAWGRLTFMHPHVESMWSGWKAAIASGDLVPASAVAAERERCAKWAEGLKWKPSPSTPKQNAELIGKITKDWGAKIAANIRSLSPEPASGGWRDISTAPDDGTEILGCWRGSKTHAIVSWSIDGWWKDNADHSAVSPPTHWMPLPEPPAMLNAATKDGERA